MSFRARRVTLSMLMMAAVLAMLAGEGVAGAQGAGVVSGTQLVPVDNCNGDLTEEGERRVRTVDAVLRQAQDDRGLRQAQAGRRSITLVKVERKH